MKRLFYISLIGILFFSCKKYPEGGLHRFASRHFETAGDEAWKLELFEVDGIDSTYLIKGIQDNPDFYEKALTAAPAGRLAKDFSCYTGKYLYNVHFIEDKKQFSFFAGSLPVYLEQREVFNPERVTNPKWQIVKLKNKELILTTTWVHSYKIRLVKHKI